MNDVTRILSAIEQGDPQAAEQLLPLVYDELRKLAAQRLAQEKPGQTLQATALVHEAYLRLVGGDEARRWDGRGHFFAAAAEAMRRILVENARRKRAEQARRRPRAASTSTRSTSRPRGPGRRPPRPRRGPRRARRPRTRPRRRARQAPLLRRPDRSSEAAERPRHLAPQRPTATGPTPGPGSAASCGEASRRRRRLLRILAGS